MIALARADFVADHGERVEHLVAGVGTVIDRKIENALAGARGIDHPHHVLGRKHHAGVEIEALVPRLIEVHGRLGGVVFGVSVDRIDQAFVDKIFRREFEALGVGAFPGRRAQIAGRYFAFAAVEFGNLAECQRIALAGIAVEIVEDAAAHADDLRIAARFAERKVVDGPVRHQHDGGGICRLLCASLAAARRRKWREENQPDGKDGAARCEPVIHHHEPISEPVSLD